MTSKLVDLGLRAAVIGANAAVNYFYPYNSTATAGDSVFRPKRMAYSRTGYRRYPSRSRGRRSMRYRMYRAPRSIRVQETMPLTISRTTNPTTATFGAGNYSLRQDVRLNTVYTADLLTAYDAYRIKKCTLAVMSLFDQGNGAAVGAANNSQWQIYAACDTNNNLAATSNGRDLCQFANYKYRSLPQGDVFYYNFYPKAINVVADGGATATSGSYGKNNPWLNMDSTGITIPHYNFLLAINQNSLASSAGITWTLTIEFEVIRSR